MGHAERQQCGQGTPLRTHCGDMAPQQALLRGRAGHALWAAGAIVHEYLCEGVEQEDGCVACIQGSIAQGVPPVDLHQEHGCVTSQITRSSQGTGGNKGMPHADAQSSCLFLLISRSPRHTFEETFLSTFSENIVKRNAPECRGLSRRTEWGTMRSGLLARAGCPTGGSGRHAHLDADLGAASSKRCAACHTPGVGCSAAPHSQKGLHLPADAFDTPM